MTQAIVVREYGNPDVLASEDIDVGAPGPGEITIAQSAIGVNFHDVYVRSGLYRTLALPGTPGIEGVGTVERLGSGVHGFAPGDRVAYVDRSYGAYAQRRNVAADRLVPVPAGVDDALVAAVLLKGLTAFVLLDRVHHLRADETILVHAAAGGVGRLLVQLAARRGATVIGTVGNEAKAKIARGDGCEHVILYDHEDVAEEVARITGGRGVEVVYDAVGRSTFAGSLAALAFCGHLVNYGQASGPVDPIAPATLGTKSLTLSRPIVFHYVAERAALLALSTLLFDALRRGLVRADAPQTFALADAAAAHRALEARATSGSVVLIP